MPPRALLESSRVEQSHAVDDSRASAVVDLVDRAAVMQFRTIVLSGARETQTRRLVPALLSRLLTTGRSACTLNGAQVAAATEAACADLLLDALESSAGSLTAPGGAHGDAPHRPRPPGDAIVVVIPDADRTDAVTAGRMLRAVTQLPRPVLFVLVCEGSADAVLRRWAPPAVVLDLADGGESLSLPAPLASTQDGRAEERPHALPSVSGVRSDEVAALLEKADRALDLGDLSTAREYLESATLRPVDDRTRARRSRVWLRLARHHGEPRFLERTARAILAAGCEGGDAIDAWLALGDAQCVQGEHDRAASAYSRALEIGERSPRDTRVYREAVARHAAYMIAQSMTPSLATGELRDEIVRQRASDDDAADRRLLAVFAVADTLTCRSRRDTTALVERAWADGRFAMPGFSGDPLTYFLTGAAQSVERFALARVIAECALGDARSRDDHVAVANARYALAGSHWGCGHPAAAYDALVAAREASSSVGWGTYLRPAELLLARLAALRGDDRLLGELAEAQGQEQSSVMQSVLHLARSEARFALGDAQGAADEARRARAALPQGAEPLRMSWREPLARALAGLGATDEAEMIAREAVALAAERDAGPLGLAHSWLAVPRERLDARDIAALKRLLPMLPGSSLERALISETVAVRLDGAESGALMIAALRIAESESLRALAERCREWLASHPASLERIGPEHHRSLLSAAELRVAELAAAGRRNSEIARELYLSVKTVEFHLSRVYRRLGVDRAQLRDVFGR